MPREPNVSRINSSHKILRHLIELLLEAALRPARAAFERNLLRGC
jgi:hypothetical protein